MSNDKSGGEDLSDKYIGVDNCHRTQPFDGELSLLSKIKHWARLLTVNQKPCGCLYWCSANRTYPSCIPKTTVHGSRKVIEERREYKHRVEERIKYVAVCTCEQCEQHFEVDIPHTKWAHNMARDEPAEDVEGRWLNAR